MSNAYNLGMGEMCADLYEGRSSEPCAHCDISDTAPTREPLSESASTRGPVL
jgi:hypothetical protein